MTKNYLPADAEKYPLTSATRVMMYESAQEYIDDYTRQLSALSRDERLQKKVLSIQKHMAEHCQTFAAMGFNRSTFTEQIASREKFLRQSETGIMEEYAEALSSLTDDQKGAFILFAHTTWFLHNAFIDQHIAKIAAAEEAGAPEKAFDDRIILGTVYAICRRWLAWWRENGTLPFERWTYEDYPEETEETV